MNNENISKVTKDKEAKFGCKGNDKFWFGYKAHGSVDMGSGMINKVAITKANVTDSRKMKHTCPSKGAIYTQSRQEIGFFKEGKVVVNSGAHILRDRVPSILESSFFRD
jgi:hypothetical protein